LRTLVFMNSVLIAAGSMSTTSIPLQVQRGGFGLQATKSLAEVDDFREQPLGRVRINAPELAIRLLLQEVAPAFHKRYPSIELDLVSEGRPVDIVREGFDAGVRLSGAVPQDMVAVRFGGPERCIVVGAPAYLKRHPRPESPGDLMLHECIRRRLPSGKLYHWEFERRAQELRIQVPGKLTLDHEGLMLEAAIDGYGLAYVFERAARPALKAGRLRAVLEDWCPEFPGMQLYYPGHRHVPGPLRAFIEVLKGAKVR
jgi:DNA-binding transcriptional LysR family regulator